MLCHPGILLEKRKGTTNFLLITKPYDRKRGSAGNEFQALTPENRQNVSLIFANMGNYLPCGIPVRDKAFLASVFRQQSPSSPAWGRRRRRRVRGFVREDSGSLHESSCESLVPNRRSHQGSLLVKRPGHIGMFRFQGSSWPVLSRVPSEICAGRLCRGRERRSASKSEREPGTVPDREHPVKHSDVSRARH
jgi:hypothetical protein